MNEKAVIDSTAEKTKLRSVKAKVAYKEMGWARYCKSFVFLSRSLYIYLRATTSESGTLYFVLFD